MKILLRSVIVLCLNSLSTHSSAASPVGNIASYGLNPSMERTSGLISSGRVELEVGEYRTKPDGMANFNTFYNYDFMIRYMGAKTGTGEKEIAEELFSEEFIESIKDQGTAQTHQFKAKYLGMTESEGPNGEDLINCTEILLFDFISDEGAGISGMASDLLRNTLFHDPSTSDMLPPGTQLEGLEVKLTIHPSIGGLGAVKIDARGFYNGIAVKMGLDLLEKN